MKSLGKLGDYEAFLDDYKGQEYELRLSASAVGKSATWAQEIARKHIRTNCHGMPPKRPGYVRVASDGVATTKEPPGTEM